MMKWTDSELVGTLFHELAHQVLYIKDDSEFNESFASAVEEIGVELWLTNRGEQDEFSAFMERRDIRSRMTELVTVARADLQALYESSLAPHEMRIGKERRLQQLQIELSAELELAGRSAPDWFRSSLNNARIASMGLYRNRVPEFLELYEECERDLPCFYEKAGQLAR